MLQARLLGRVPLTCIQRHDPVAPGRPVQLQHIAAHKRKSVSGVRMFRGGLGTHDDKFDSSGPPPAEGGRVSLRRRPYRGGLTAAEDDEIERRHARETPESGRRGRRRGSRWPCGYAVRGGGETQEGRSI